MMSSKMMSFSSRMLTQSYDSILIRWNLRSLPCLFQIKFHVLLPAHDFTTEILETFKSVHPTNYYFNTKILHISLSQPSNYYFSVGY